MEVIPTVLRSRLAGLDLIGEGASARVFEVHNFRLRAFQDLPLAYKEYMNPSPETAAIAVNVMKFRDRLVQQHPRACRELDTFFAWPLELVEDDQSGDVCGFLMAMAEPAFCWDRGKLAGRPRTMDWLVVEDDRLQRINADPLAVTVADRLLLMTQLTFAFAILHAKGWVFGDLSFKNVAFRLNPPQILILDCDGTAELGDPRQYQQHTPFWDPPEYQGGQGQCDQDLRTDVYKLGLAIIRCLKPGPGATTTKGVGRLYGVLNNDGLDLVTRAISDDRDERPRSAKEIFTYLRQVTDQLLVPPRIGYAELLTPLVLMAPQGQEGRVAWAVEGATEISILIDESAPPVRSVAPADHLHECAFPVPRSGQVVILASNPYGMDRRIVGDVTLFEVPAFNASLGDLPIPVFPALGAVTVEVPGTPLPGPGHGLPGTPVITVPDVVIPMLSAPGATVPTLDVFPVTSALRIGRAVPRLARDPVRRVLKSRHKLANLNIMNRWKHHG